MCSLRSSCHTRCTLLPQAGRFLQEGFQSCLSKLHELLVSLQFWIASLQVIEDRIYILLCHICIVVLQLASLMQLTS